MPRAQWSLQDAKNRFSAVVAAAEAGTPQLVTKRGRPSVVVVAVEDYEKLRGQERNARPSFIEHLLSAPKRPAEIADDEELFPRLELEPRDVDL
jgi:prevent-host-death family protein